MAIQLFAELKKELTESLSVSDDQFIEFTKELPGESFSLTDDYSKVLTALKSLSESFSLTDDYSKVWDLGRTYSESFSLSDTILKEISRSISESFSLSDAETTQIIKILSESNSLSDNLLNSIGKIISEAFSLSDGDTTQMQRILSESFSVSDDYARVWDATLEYSESFTFTDAILKETQREISESFGFTDVILKEMQREISEAFGLTESLLKETQRELSDSFSLADDLVTFKLVDKILSESIALSDDYSRVWDATPEYSESFSLSDLYERNWVLARTYNESFSLSDDELNEIQRTISESFSLSDEEINSITKELGETISLLIEQATPLAHFKLNDNLATTNVVDSVGSYDGTGNKNSEAFNTTGKINDAFEFDGNDFVNINAVLTPLASTTKGTWSAWVKPVDATPPTSAMFIAFGDTDNAEFIRLYILSTGKLQVDARNTTDFQFKLNTDNVAFSDNTWTHVAVVHDGTEPVVYVDGVKVAQTFTNSIDKTFWFNDAVNLDNGRIGDNRNQGVGEKFYFNGTIDETKFFNRGLSATEIKKIFDGGRGVSFSTDRLISEAFSLSDGDTMQMQRILLESLGLTDVYSRVWNLARIYSESQTLSDDLLNEPGKNLSESFTFTDSREPFSIIKLLTESNSLTDNYARLWTLARTYSETMNLTDEEYNFITLRDLTESLNISDGDIKVLYEKVLSESFGITDRFIKTIYDRLILETARTDVQNIITEQGIRGVIIRQTETTATMGDVSDVSEARYDVYVSVQDITKKDRQIHEMGLAVPGNVKAFFFHEYTDDITGNGNLKVQTGDILHDDDLKYWRIEQIIGERKMQSEEVFRVAVLKKIDLDQ